MMLNIGITQRIHFIKEYNEYRDELDQSWSNLFANLGIMQIILPNNSELIKNNYIDNLNLNGVILSGGEFKENNNNNVGLKNRNEFENNLISYCIGNKIPILGVCRGMQILNNFFGGKLEKIDNHVGKYHNIKNFSKLSISKNVNSYHEFKLSKDNLPENFEIIATDLDGEIESILDKKNNLLGIMWHPERNNPFDKNDLKLMSDFFNL
tara:strand:- start:1457 stop:2083 length:627 start_codon:yes stop_codon:yes gene_type:complete